MIRAAILSMLLIVIGLPPRLQAVQGWAGNGPASIIGHVLPSPGEHFLPDAGRIIVTLQMVGKAATWVETVREGGRFDFRGLLAGRYDITITCPGYLPTKKQISIQKRVSENANLVYVNLGPREKSLASSTTVPDTVTVQALQVPQEALDELEKALAESAKNKPEESIRHLKKAIEIHPEFFEAYNNLAAQHMKLGDLKGALESLEKSIRIQPENPMAYRNIGLILLRAKSYNEAIQFLEKSLEQEPDHVSTLMSLGKGYFDSGQPEKSLPAFQKVIDLEPENATAHFALGYGYYQLKRFDEAAKAFEAVLSLEPEGSRSELARKLLSQIKKM